MKTLDRYPQFKFIKIHLCDILNKHKYDLNIGRLRKSGGQNIDLISLPLNKFS